MDYHPLSSHGLTVALDLGVGPCELSLALARGLVLSLCWSYQVATLLRAHGYSIPVWCIRHYVAAGILVLWLLQSLHILSLP